MIRRPPRSTQSRSSAASDVYKRQIHESEQILTQPATNRLLVTRPFDGDPGAQRVDQLLGCLDTQVRAEQCVLDVLPGLLVQSPTGQQGQQPLAQDRVGARQPCPKALQAACRRLGPLDRAVSYTHLTLPTIYSV